MKKLVSFVLTLALVLSCVSMITFTANAEAQDITSYLTYEIVDGEAVITKCDTSVNGDFYIPETLGGYPVTAIKKLNQFGDNLFLYCENLTSIILPDSLTYIEDYAFACCYKLSYVKLGSNLKSIGEYTFERNYALKSITIPEGVESIGRYAFSESGLESISLPDSLQAIYIGTFNSCTALKSINIPKGVATIDRMVFMRCTALSEMTVDSNNAIFYSEGNCIVEKATQKLIEGCNNSVIPDNIKVIGDSAFYGCEELKQAIIPEGVTTIEIDAFSNCSSLEKVTFPESLETIGERAFWCCTELKDITLGVKLESIGASAFYDCTGLEKVCYLGTKDQWNNIDIASGNTYLTDAERIYINGTSTGSIIGATVDIGSSLTINYFAEAPENAKMRFTSSSGRVTETEGVLDESTGYYKFAYTGINPQCMNDTIKAELMHGENILDTKENYSVKAYCENQILKSATDLEISAVQYNKLQTLLADMLVYGSEAQKYRDYNTEDLPDTSEWVSQYKSTFTVPTGVKKVTGNTDVGNKAKSVGLNMANVNKIYFKLILTDEDVVITLNDNVIDRSELIKNTDGTYTLYSDGIKATQFDDVFTLKLIKDGKEITKVEYNVNAYIEAKYNTESVSKIVQALSNYGRSAKNYMNSFVNTDDNFELEDDIL